MLNLFCFVLHRRDRTRSNLLERVYSRILKLHVFDRAADRYEYLGY